MATKHCRDIQNYIATKNTRKHWKLCCDIKLYCRDKTEGSKLEVCRDCHPLSCDKSWQKFKNNCCDKVCNVSTNHSGTNNAGHGNFVATFPKYVATQRDERAKNSVAILIPLS